MKKSPYHKKLTNEFGTNKILTYMDQYIITIGISIPRATWHVNREIYLENGLGPGQTKASHVAFNDSHYGCISTQKQCHHNFFCPEEYMIC